MRTAVIILAAGQGKRFGSPLPKVLAQVHGKPMVAMVVDAVRQSGVTDRPVVVVGAGAEQIKAALGDYCEYVYQAEQLGTGHAVAQCRSLLKGNTDVVLVLHGDHPLVTSETIQMLVSEHAARKPTITLATATVSDFEGWRKRFENFGRIVRNRDLLWGIVEAKDATAEQRKIKEVNTGYYCFNASWLWEHIDQLPNDNAQHEYYLTDLVALAMIQSKVVYTVSVDAREALGVNTLEDLQQLDQFIS